jgi:hypothetical protein
VKDGYALSTTLGNLEDLGRECEASISKLWILAREAPLLPSATMTVHVLECIRLLEAQSRILSAARAVEKRTARRFQSFGKRWRHKTSAAERLSKEWLPAWG